MTGANAGHEATTCKSSPPYMYYFGLAAVPSLALCLVLFFVVQKEWWMALIGWGVGINIMGFILMNMDKCIAVREGHVCCMTRIPEGVLIWGVAFLLGFAGIWIGSCVAHHKTVKQEFRKPLIVVTIIDILILGGIAGYIIYRAANNETV